MTRNVFGAPVPSHSRKRDRQLDTSSKNASTIENATPGSTSGGFLSILPLLSQYATPLILLTMAVMFLVIIMEEIGVLDVNNMQWGNVAGMYHELQSRGREIQSFASSALPTAYPMQPPSETSQLELPATKLSSHGSSQLSQNLPVPPPQQFIYKDYEIIAHPSQSSAMKQYKTNTVFFAGTETVPWENHQDQLPHWAKPLTTARQIQYIPTNAFGYRNGTRNDSHSEEWESVIHGSEERLYASISNACMVPYRGKYVAVFRKQGKMLYNPMPPRAQHCTLLEHDVCGADYEELRVPQLPSTLLANARRVEGYTVMLGMHDQDYNLYHDWVNWVEYAMEMISIQNETIRNLFPVNVPLAKHAISLGECYKNRTSMAERGWNVRNDYYEMHQAGIRVSQGVPSISISQVMREVLPSDIPIILPECDLVLTEVEAVCFDHLIVPVNALLEVNKKPEDKRMARVIGPFRDTSYRLYSIAPPQSFCQRVSGSKRLVVTLYGRENQFRSIENAADVAVWVETSQEISALFPGIKIEVRRITEPMSGPRNDARIFADTDVMITPHGAAQVNTIYMPEGSVVFDINPGCLGSKNLTSSPGCIFMGLLGIRTWGVFTCMDHYIRHVGPTADHFNCNDLRANKTEQRPCSFPLTYDNVIYLFGKMRDKLYETQRQRLPADRVLHGCSSSGVECRPFFEPWCA